MRRALVALLVLGVVAVLAGPAGAQTYNSGSTGADGALTMPAGERVSGTVELEALEPGIGSIGLDQRSTDRRAGRPATSS